MPRVTITVPEKTAQPYRFQLDRQVVTLGRGSENDIAIDCSSVSVAHAEMHRIDGGYELRDTGSTNGTTLDDVRKQVIPLKNGASVKLGDVAFDFLLNDDELQALAQESPKQELPPLGEPERAPKEMVKEKIVKQRNDLTNTPPAGIGFGKIIIFLLLAAAAFFAGMAVRHQGDTGHSLLESLREKHAPTKTIEVPVAVPTPTPAAAQTEAPAGAPTPEAPAN